MIYLIVGRSGAGKDYLAAKLAAHGLKVVKSCTTRPKRTDDENTHIFLSQKEADTITDKVATTVINGYEYFATKSQVEKSDVYIIDPHGIEELVKNMPETSFHIVHVTANDDTRREFAIKRSDNPEHESQVFDARNADEDEQFKAFESAIEDKTLFTDNLCAVHHFQNDYCEKSVDDYVDYLIAFQQEFNNLKRITKQCVSLGILTSSEPNHIDVYYKANPEKPKSVPLDIFVNTLLSDDEGFITILHSYLSHDLDTPNPVIYTGDDESDDILCPVCGESVARNDDFDEMRPKHCPNCGTRLLYQ